MVANNAGMPATPADLINVDEVIGKYYDVVPDPNVPEQRVSFGTSGHRGSSLKTSFNEAHIVAITQAIAEYRKKAGVTGPLYIGRDTHALSEPAWKTAIEVLVANGVTVRIDSRDDFTPTPVVSQAILTHNRAADGTQRFTGEGLADGIVVTPSHNPPTDGGFKYDPVTGGPAPSDVTNAIADRANELLGDFKNIKRVPFEQAVKSDLVERFDFREHYVADLENVIDFDVIRSSGVRLGIDPLGGASVNYWPLMNEKFNLTIDVVRPQVDDLELHDHRPRRQDSHGSEFTVRNEGPRGLPQQRRLGQVRSGRRHRSGCRPPRHRMPELGRHESEPLHRRVRGVSVRRQSPGLAGRRRHRQDAGLLLPDRPRGRFHRRQAR